MSHQRAHSEQFRRATGHPLYKSERQALILIAKTWPGHRGVDFRTTTSENIYLLIMDARKGIPVVPRRVRCANSQPPGAK